MAKIWRWVLQTRHLTRLKPAQLAASGSLHPDRDGSLQGRPSLEISYSIDWRQIFGQHGKKEHQISTKFTSQGTYERTSAENYEEMLKVQGLLLDYHLMLYAKKIVSQILDVNMLLRKAACASTPKMEVK